jgi:hypothetical protein
MAVLTIPVTKFKVWESAFKDTRDFAVTKDCGIQAGISELQKRFLQFEWSSSNHIATVKFCQVLRFSVPKLRGAPKVAPRRCFHCGSLQFVAATTVGLQLPTSPPRARLRSLA